MKTTPTDVALPNARPPVAGRTEIADLRYIGRCFRVTANGVRRLFASVTPKVPPRPRPVSRRSPARRSGIVYRQAQRSAAKGAAAVSEVPHLATRHQPSGGAQGPGPVQMLLQSGG